MREWRKVRNQRQDFHHKTARTLVGAYDVISLEELRIGNMTGSAKGTVDAPGTNVAQKAGTQQEHPRCSLGTIHSDPDRQG